MTTVMHVVDKENGILKCHYCEKEQRKGEYTIIGQP
jgi:aspartate carbamoyltransferase regulatory subunit